MERLIIVSNRLPVTAKLEGKKLVVSPSMGGLATGVDPVRKKYPSVWVGWPGDTARWSDEKKAKLTGLLEAEGCVPIYLTTKEMKGFYLEYSNAGLWPLYHSLPSLMPMEIQGWDEYRKVNKRFADAVAAVYKPGDVIWVHDFQLTLVPQMVRELIPDARIGYFLHIPFPASEIFRILPQREELLRGMMGADVVGFHTTGYANNFASAALRVLGLESKMDTITVADGRSVQYGAFPLGVDMEAFGTTDSESKISASLETIRRGNPGIKLMLAVDRLDYTKGIPRRLLAFERLLEQHAEFRSKVILMQIAVPSRSEVVAYEDNKRSVDEMVGRINGRFGAPGYHPIHYLTNGFSREELVHLYRGVDAMVVTPLRDGMNLVAKEFCASRIDEQGVLVLSEFAGAAAEMGESVLVNPYDLNGTAAAYASALTMSPGEAQKRMRALRARLTLLDHRAWGKQFLGCLIPPKTEVPVSPTAPKITRVSAADLLGYCEDKPVALFLDYDGTLVPITRVPELAAPDVALRELLTRLSARSDTYVSIVSGRSRDTLDAWLGDLDVHLFAEHAIWERAPHERWISRLEDVPTNWLRGVRLLLDRACMEVPGSFVEEKSHSLVWHYRMSEPEHALGKARELHFQLVDALSNLPVIVSAGKKIVEVRAAGVHKGDAIFDVRRRLGDHLHVPVAVGDDSTDEDMFRCLPDTGLAIRVGSNTGGAHFSLPNVHEVRKFLILLADRPIVARPKHIPPPMARIADGHVVTV